METNRQIQRELYPVLPVPAPHMADECFICSASWEGVLRYCVQRSGHDQYEIADLLHISHGHMAKVLKGTATLSGWRLIRFQQITQCVAPAQWMAYHSGASLTMRDPASARIAELERELHNLRKSA